MAGGKFSMDVSRFISKTKLKAEDVVRGKLYGIAGNVVKNTPVKTGKARGNWIMTMDQGPVKKQTAVLDKSGEQSLDRIAAALEKFQIGKTKTIWLTNCLPYIIMLEYGWSKQSPAGIVRLALLNAKNVTVHDLGFM